MTKPTLFLDIDGPLHPTNVPFLGQDNKPYGEKLFRWVPKLLEALAQFPNTQVILHSSWRYCWDTDEELRSYLPKELNDLIVATTGREVIDRYGSILAYAAKHSITKYVIVDDDSSAFPYGCKELVHCMPSQGLSRQTTYGKLLTKLGEINGNGETETETE